MPHNVVKLRLNYKKYKCPLTFGNFRTFLNSALVKGEIITKMKRHT